VGEDLIQSISDTARWVAVYRALESERPDALFRDPYARRLAGERGAALVREIPRGKDSAWAMIVRTRVLDEMILRAVQGGVDTVLNLAAGLDTRPYRLPLPPSLRWIEVDLPEILAFKEAELAGERRACSLDRVALDLADAHARRAFFRQVRAGSRQTLVVAEGLLVYLEREAVAALAADLHAQPVFQTWIFDLVSPGLLRGLQRSWGKTLAGGGVALRFAPPEGTEFFRPRGWNATEVRSTLEEGGRLGRTMPLSPLVRLLARLMTRRQREALRHMAVLVRMERAQTPEPRRENVSRLVQSRVRA
jgi:methyltransferase (TIGR00027 family)